ncbi:MAG: hypothetical protein WBX17_01695 [Microbacterium sp.]
MEPFWAVFDSLFLRDEESLTDHERGSLEILTAFIDDLEGISRGSEARRWCARARLVREFVLEHGRLPEAGDSGVSAAALRWLAIARRGDLNSFQRLLLERIPGWTWA